MAIKSLLALIFLKINSNYRLAEDLFLFKIFSGVFIASNPYLYDLLMKITKKACVSLNFIRCP